MGDMARNCKCAGDIGEGKINKIQEIQPFRDNGGLRRMLGDVVKSFFSFG